MCCCAALRYIWSVRGTDRDFIWVRALLTMVSVWAWSVLAWMRKGLDVGKFSFCWGLGGLAGDCDERPASWVTF